MEKRVAKTDAGEYILESAFRYFDTQKFGSTQAIIKNSEDMEYLVEKGEYDPTKYHYPPRDVESEKKSLIKHILIGMEQNINYFDGEPKISKKAVSKLAEHLGDRCNIRSGDKVGWNTYDMTKEGEIKLILWIVHNKVNRMSSPGLPYKSQYKTNGDWIDINVTQLVGLCYNRLQNRKEFNGWHEDYRSAYELMDLGLTDGFTVFIKEEPHSTSKMQKGTYRIIAQQSLVDSIVDHVILHQLKQAMELKCSVLPLVNGLPFNTVEGQRIMIARVLRMMEQISSDCSTYDFTMGYANHLSGIQAIYEVYYPGEDIWTELEFGLQEVYRRLLLSIHICIMLKNYVLSDGTVWEQLFPGSQSSGGFTTTMLNGIVRSLYEYHVQLEEGFEEPDCCSNGDDNVTRWVPNYVERLNKLGCFIKKASVVESKSTQFEFNSRLFKKIDDNTWETSYLNRQKRLANFLSHASNEEQLMSLGNDLNFKLIEQLPSLKAIVNKQAILERIERDQNNQEKSIVKLIL